MLKRSVIVLTMTIALIVAIEPVQTVHGVILSAEEIASLKAANTSARNNQTAGGGSSFVRALKAPFKAIGRIFGRGKKDDNKLQRISEKDLKRFESATAKQTSVSNVPQTDSAASPPSNVTTPPVNQSGDQLNQQLTNEQSSNQQVSNPNSNQTTNLQVMAIEHLDEGRDFLNKGNLNEAIEELSKAASLDHTLAEARTLLGVAYEGKGLHDAAMRSFEAAVEAQNKNPQHLNNLGYALYSTGDYENAIKYLKRAVKLAPEDARIWNNLGLAQVEREKFDDAFKSFTHAVGEYKSRLAIATRLQRSGKNKDAIKHLERARALKPNSPEVLARLVMLYGLSDKNEQADEARRSLIVAQTLANAAVTR